MKLTTFKPVTETMNITLVKDEGDVEIHVDGNRIGWFADDGQLYLDDDLTQDDFPGLKIKNGRIVTK